jgi:putative tricarboxylic transport membrane protein
MRSGKTTLPARTCGPGELEEKMADRIFAGIALTIVFIYGVIAFTIIEAPFQYDPLGPETWPQILAVVAGLCCLYIIIRPDHHKYKGLGHQLLVRIFVVLAMLSGFAYPFEALGFILSTTLFCGVLSRLLGASSLQAGLFGVASGVLGYGLCVGVLDLNLPLGAVLKTLRGAL